MMTASRAELNAKKRFLMSKKSIALLATAIALVGGTANAQTVVTQVGGRLALTTPNSDQTVKVEVGPLAGVVRAYGFPGIADGTEYSSVTGVAVTTGAGLDKVEVKLETPGSFDLRVDTGSGESETKVAWKILSGAAAAAATIDIVSATSGRQLAAVEVDSDARNATVTMRARNANDFTGKVASSNTSDFLRAVVDTTSPKFAFDLASAASVLEFDAVGGNAALANDLKYNISQSRPASLQLNWALRGGNLGDVVEAKTSASGSTIVQQGLAQFFGGDDNVKFETEGFSTVTGLTIDGGAGNDQLAQIIKGRFQNSQTLQTKLFGRAGDDELVLTTDTGIYGTGLPNDLFPIIDCGLGNDRFNAFGIIRSCEARL